MALRTLGSALAALAFIAVSGAAAGEGSDGLTCKLVKKEQVFKYGTREIKRQSLVLEVKNEGKTAVLLPAGLRPDISAKDAEGKDVPKRETRGFGRPAAAETKDDDKKEDKPVTVTILKPGQTMTVQCNVYGLNFPDKGTYKLTAALEVKGDDKEVLPGIKLWSGTLKSAEFEYEVTRAARRPAGKRPAQQRTPKKKPAENKEEKKEDAG